MGGLQGHVLLGLIFLLIGSWHLFNHTKLHFTHQHHYFSPNPWFPSSTSSAGISRHLELYIIITGCIIFTFFELNRHPLINPDDGSIPSHLLRHLEHASMAFSFLLYAIFAIILDTTTTKLSSFFNRRPNPNPNPVVWSLVSLSFALELLLFHFHSTDHVGVERQYHLLLEFVLAVCLATTLMGIGFPRSFAVGFVRSVAVVAQGAWLILMGIMLWTPGFVPKGCVIREKNGREGMECDGEASVERGKALVNILFSWSLIGLSSVAASFYLWMGRLYGRGFVVLDDQEEEMVVAAAAAGKCCDRTEVGV